MSCLMPFCRALSASQRYRAQTLRHIRDPLLGYRKLPCSRQEDDMFCLGFHVSYLVDGGLASSEAALITFNQCLGMELQSFAQYTRKDLICDIVWFPFFSTGHRPLRIQSLGMLSSSHILQISWCMFVTNSSPPGLNNLEGRPSCPAALLFLSRCIATLTTLWLGSGISTPSSSIGAGSLSSLQGAI